MVVMPMRQQHRRDVDVLTRNEFFEPLEPLRETLASIYQDAIAARAYEIGVGAWEVISLLRSSFQDLTAIYLVTRTGCQR